MKIIDKTKLIQFNTTVDSEKYERMPWSVLVCVRLTLLKITHDWNNNDHQIGKEQNGDDQPENDALQQATKFILEGTMSISVHQYRFVQHRIDVTHSNGVSFAALESSVDRTLRENNFSSDCWHSSDLRGIKGDFHLTSWIDIHRRWFIRYPVKRIIHLKGQSEIIWKHGTYWSVERFIGCPTKKSWLASLQRQENKQTTNKKNRDKKDINFDQARIEWIETTHLSDTSYCIAFLVVLC